jgi:hypothetical protein
MSREAKRAQRFESRLMEIINVAAIHLIGVEPPDFSSVRLKGTREALEILHQRLGDAVKALMELHTVYKDQMLCRKMASQFPWRGKALSRSEHLHLAWMLRCGITGCSSC